MSEEGGRSCPCSLTVTTCPGLTPEELAEAHVRDLAAQEAHDVRYHTYWFDPDSGSVFCLAEGPSSEAVEAVHRQAHGQVASVIIELDPTLPLNALMGPIPQHPAGTAYTAPAMRAIVFTDICDSVAQTQALGDEGHMSLLREHDQIVRLRLDEHGGREVKHTGDGIMASFTSVASAITFAAQVQRSPRQAQPDDRRGAPRGEHRHQRGRADHRSRRRSLRGRRPAGRPPVRDADAGDVVVSVAVRELCIGKPFQFESLTPSQLKGLPEPVQTYRVRLVGPGVERRSHPGRFGRRRPSRPLEQP